MTDKKTNGWREVNVRNKKYGGILRHILVAEFEGVAFGSYVITQTEPSLRQDNYQPEGDNYMDDGSFELVFLHGTVKIPIVKFENVAFDAFDAVLDFLKIHKVNQHLRGVEKVARELME